MHPSTITLYNKSKNLTLPIILTGSGLELIFDGNVITMHYNNNHITIDSSHPLINIRILDTVLDILQVPANNLYIMP